MRDIRTHEIKRKSRGDWRGLLFFNLLLVATLSGGTAPTVHGQTESGQPGKSQTNEGQAAQSLKGWAPTGSHSDNYYLTTDTKVRHGGRMSGTLISKNAASDEGFGSMKQEIKADDYRGKRLRFSGYLKTEVGEKHAALWMRVEGEDGKLLAFDNMDSRPIKGTTGWKKYEIVLDVPAAAQYMVLGALFEGKGQIWIDDLKLEEVSLDVASTDMLASPEVKSEMEEEDEEYRRTRKEAFERAVQQARERLSKMPTRPVNFNFEG